MYRTNFGIGHSIREILEAHNPPRETPGDWVPATRPLRHRQQLPRSTSSSVWPASCLGVVTSLVAQHMYAMPSYAFIAKDYTPRSLRCIRTTSTSPSPDVRCLRPRFDLLHPRLRPWKPTRQSVGSDARAQGSHHQPPQLGFPSSSASTPSSLRPQRRGRCLRHPREADPGGPVFASSSSRFRQAIYGMDVLLANSSSAAAPPVAPGSRVGWTPSMAAVTCSCPSVLVISSCTTPSRWVCTPPP